jgi:hypothetical protein
MDKGYIAIQQSSKVMQVEPYGRIIWGFLTFQNPLKSAASDPHEMVHMWVRMIPLKLSMNIELYMQPYHHLFPVDS